MVLIEEMRASCRLSYFDWAIKLCKASDLSLSFFFSSLLHTSHHPLTLCTSILPPPPFPHSFSSNAPERAVDNTLYWSPIDCCCSRFWPCDLCYYPTTHRWLCGGGNTSAPISYIFSISFFSFLFSSSMRRLIWPPSFHPIDLLSLLFFLYFSVSPFSFCLYFIDIYLFVLSIRSLIAAAPSSFSLSRSMSSYLWVKKTNERKRGEVPSGVCHLWCRSSHSNWFDGRFPP